MKEGVSMKNKIVILVTLILFILSLSGCGTNTTTTTAPDEKINILATADTHSILPNKLVSFVESERKKDENVILVDAGDFFDMQSKQMQAWFTGEKLVEVSSDGIPTYETVAKEREGEAPIVKEMGKLMYDAAVLGNHEFVANNKETLDTLISDFKKYHITILSANTYNSDGSNYTKPYIIKKIQTDQGTINVGILGLTLKEVGERYDWTEEEGLKPADSRELEDMKGYEGKLYMEDLVQDAEKWVDIMKQENADIIVAVVHSGEKPKKPKNPGNRIQELAQEVDGIDAIVAAHTHKEISQHDYNNKSDETVIVTQPGKHGECISRINFKLKKEQNGWIVVDKSSEIVKF
ncbi:MAG: metallophosphoesterase [Syntrophaceticus sp.]|jgi:2',3'-cyclic-nucleotide 2'-phosphodiesterase (5'-nucleotidase family)|nr:metallophosphoesterase [Syntrophaceticus sp.]MDD3313988.1 metallophosphoesterase [Syntrophaceticus sp.]MDD4359065.1 metallophosphoesterase [Syntrophaceticus sp.]MDD4783110.1 metallophosphoesterase [Syntrophaceticus sp.]